MTSDAEPSTSHALHAVSWETLGLVDADTPAAFDALTRLAMRLFGVSAALISIVQEEKDGLFFLSQQGVKEPWKSQRQTPLSHSFCQHVKRDNKPLIVNDAHQHPCVKNNPAVTELGVVAYLGVPVRAPDGAPIGAICVIEDRAREWTADDLATLEDLARCVNDEILLRATLISNEQSHRRAERYNAKREAISLAFMAPDLSLEARFQHLLQSSCAALGVTSGRILKFDCGLTETLFIRDQNRTFAMLAAHTNLETLTRKVTCECAHVYVHDMGQGQSGLRVHTPEPIAGCYAGTPLMFNGMLFGAIEFASNRPKSEPWTEEDLSILSIVSMFASAHIGLFGQLTMLQNSEQALIQELCTNDRPIILKM